MSHRYALIIGNDKYDDTAFSQLEAPMADVRDLAELLQHPDIGGFHQVQTLIDEPKRPLGLKIANFFKDRKQDDLLLLYISGHGVLDHRGFLFLVAKDTDHDLLTASAISTRFITEEMDSSRSKRQVLILDCCYGGAFSRGTKGAKGITKATFKFEGEGYAKVVLTAASATQFAWEGSQVISDADKSLFTHFLTEGLREGIADLDGDGQITLDEWYQYACEQVVNSNPQQKPQIWIYGQQGKPLIIAQNPYLDQYIDRLIQPPYPLIHYNDELSFGETDKENIIVEGDNFLALRALLPQYTGRIKCVYIDSLYSTVEGNRDHGDNLSALKLQEERLNEAVDIEVKELAGHDQWAEMMRRCMILVRELLRDDGAIFVSIDDTEFLSLRMLMDEIFPANFVGTFIWKSRQFRSVQDRSGISVDHEYVLCYARGPQFRFRGSSEDVAKYKNPDGDPNGPWISRNLTGLAGATKRPHMHYDVVNPATRERYLPDPSRGWIYNQEKMKELIAAGRILWPKSPGMQPRLKRYLSDTRENAIAFSTLLDVPSYVAGTRQLSEMTGSSTFAYPKPCELIKTLINQASETDSIILDAFAGSGATGQAVLELNKEDGGTRHFILIETSSEVARDVTVKRLRRVIAGSDSQAGTGGGFRYCTVSSEHYTPS